jgi:hypothetical protein
MDMLKKLSPAAQAVLAGCVLYLIFSFFDWQQVCGGAGGFKVCAGVSEWHGFGGTITVLSAIALLAWEIIRLLGVKVDLGGVSHGLVSLALAGLLLVLTVITFLTHNEARHWPSWIGLLLAIGIAVAAWIRGREEGVEMPDVSAMRGTGSGPGSPPPSPPSDESAS